MSPENGELQVLDLISRLTVDTTDDGRLVTDLFQSERTEWVETDPYVYHETEGTDVLAFDVTDGRVDDVYLNSQPTNTFEPVQPHRRRAVAVGAIGGSVAGFGLSLVGWAGRGAWRRLQHHRSDTEGPASGDRPAGTEGREEGSA